MNNKAMIGLMLAGALGMAGADMSSASAQSTLGGAKTPQNKIGGVAKPAPVIGGATVHPYSPPRPAPVIGIAKQGSPGPVTPGISGATAGNTRPNPPVNPPNKGKPVVTAVSNLKCASGACTSKGPKP